MKCIGLFFLVLCLVLVRSTYAAEDEKKEPAQYERYDHGVIGNPGDAAGKMVLAFEKNREMKPSGNVVHVEGTDEYLGKEIDEIKSRMTKLESKLSELEKRVSDVEGKFKVKNR